MPSSDVDGQQLLERECELAVVKEACLAALAGDGKVLTVAGPAGIGKSALLQAARREGDASGMTVLTAAGHELERELAFGVVRQLFEATLRTLPDDVRSELLRGAAGLSTRVLLESTPAQAPEAVTAALHGLYWLAAELAARRPVLVVVDDAHWADAASLRWLAYLGRRLEGVPLLALIALREGEPSAESALLDRVTGLPGALSVRPGPLSDAAVARWLAAELAREVGPAFAHACKVATGGNPFLLRELISSLPAETLATDVEAAQSVEAIAPASIARAVLVRLAPLGSDAVSVAEAAAVLSTDARLDRVATLAGVPIERTAEIADRLTDAGILDGGEPLSFSHPILRSAIHEQTPAQRRGLAHLRAAELLLSADEGTSRAASHLLLAPVGGREWVASTLRSAAAVASARGAPDAAVSLLRRACAERAADGADMLLELAHAEFTVQDSSAVAHARQAMAVARTPAARAQAGLALARALTELGQFDAALDALTTVERESTGLDAPIRLALQVEAMMLTSWHRGTEPLKAPLTMLRVDEMGGATPVERLLLALRAMEAVSTGDDRARVLAVARRVLSTADPQLPDDEYAILAASRTLGFSDALDEARAAFDALIDEGRARGSVATLVHALGMRAEAGLRLGVVQEAEADASEAHAIAVEHGLELAVAVTLPILVEVMLEREPASAAGTLLERFGDSEAVPRGYARQMLHFASGIVALARGDAGAAAVHFEECGREQSAWGEHNPTARPWRSQLALALAELGRSGEAAAMAEEELRLARRFGAERATGIALRARALLLRGSAQIAGLREAERILASSPARLEHARALFHLGAALRRGGHTKEAREVLVEALDGANRCGAHMLAEQVRSELRISGARPRRDRIRGPDSLTASERRVAELAARGLKNKEIAQELFLTTKTVETHLGHVYPKLGITGRQGLEPALRSGAPNA